LGRHELEDALAEEFGGGGGFGVAGGDAGLGIRVTVHTSGGVVIGGGVVFEGAEKDGGIVAGEGEVVVVVRGRLGRIEDVLVQCHFRS
jgi:hypothetical protein